MKGSRVSRRYAKALFDLALEQKLLTQVETDMRLLGKDLAESESLKMMMASPVIAHSEKQKAFSTLYQKRLQQLTFHFVQLLFVKKREAELPYIVESFSELLDEHRGIIRGEIHSVTPLSAGQMSALKTELDRLYGKDVRLTQQVDTSLLGGFMVKINNRIFDMTLRNQLEDLRHSLVKS